MITNPREFIQRNLILLMLWFVLLMLDIFVPGSFYNNFIDSMRIFQCIQITLGAALIGANIYYLHMTKEE